MRMRLMATYLGVPYQAGLGPDGAAATLFVFGACNGLGNVIFFTAGQRWTPQYLLGRIMGLMMMCTLGAYPASVALTGIEGVSSRPPRKIVVRTG